MRLISLKEKQFKSFADKHEQITFHQTKEWADLKAKNGWEAHYVGLDDNTVLRAAAILLAKKMPIINKYLFYSPRGILIDYNNKKLLEKFTNAIKKYIKDNNGFMLKIDPYVEYQERDNNGDIVEGGYNNKKAHNNLLNLKYKHFGFNKMQDTLQPRWMHVIDINGRSEEEIQKDMESKTRQILRKNEKLGVVTREITREELPLFKEIMQKTSDRRDFIDRPLSYYESMWDSLHDSGILKIMIAEADFKLYEKNTKKEKEEIEKALKDRIYKHDNNLLKMNEKKYKSTNKQEEERIKQLDNQLEKIKEYKKEYGDKALLGGILFLIYGNEVLSLFGGSLETLMNFQSAYTLHYAGIKYAIDNKYKRYNFYGITGDFRKENPLYGLYLFKKSFGGKVVELLGEYDLVVSPFYYHTYNIMYKTYHGIKNVLKKLKK